MDWSWITPPIAAALAGAIGAVGALIGAVVTGAINSRNTKRQIEAQTQIALQQLQSQERIAEANRAEQRAQTLLGERRVLYGQVVEHGSLIKYWAHRQVATTRKLAANDIRDAAKEWNAANQEGLPEEAWSDAAVSYGERVDVQHRLREEVSQLRPLLAALELVGAPGVTEVAKRLAVDALHPVIRDQAKANEQQKVVEQALNDFIAAANQDLGGRPGA